MPLTLHPGSRGFNVAVVQAQLNAANATPQKLPVDGAFGLRTQAAVIAFQRRAGITADGVVGPATHTALAPANSITAINHDRSLIAQPTETPCWAASTAMMIRSSVAAVRARTPADMIAPDGSLRNSSGSDQGVVTGTRYGSIHGLRCHAPQSWSVATLINALRQGPLMLDTLWDSAEYAGGSGSPGHMVVISAVVSNNQSSGDGTHLHILDPWPPLSGDASWVQYRTWIMEFPTRTYRVFHR